MLEELRQQLQALQRPAGIEGDPGALPLGIAAIDEALGGGLARGALHEIAASGEAYLASATGFVLGLAGLRSNVRATGSSSPLPYGERSAHAVRRVRGNRPIENPLPPTSLRSVDLSPQGRGEEKSVVWIAEDMALAESGAPYGPGLDAFGLAPERLVTVAVAQRRDLLWAMEEALRCRAVGAVIGEVRHGAIDMVAVRRLSLAATESGALALLLRSAPPTDASTAATRWIVGAALRDHRRWSGEGSQEIANADLTPTRRAPRVDLPLAGGGEKESAPRFAATLVRNRRGPIGSWILQWSDIDARFLLATHTEPVAAATLNRPRRKVA